MVTNALDVVIRVFIFVRMWGDAFRCLLQAVPYLRDGVLQNV